MAGHRIECGEELVSNGHLGVAEGVEQGALTCIGVAHQRCHRYARAVASQAVLFAPLAYLVQLLLQLLDATLDKASVGLQLGLAGATGADATSEALQVGPLAYQPG